MSSEMAVTDNNSGKETEAMDCELAATANSEDSAEPIKSPIKELPEKENKETNQEQEMEVDEGVVEDSQKATKRRASVLSDQVEDDFRGFDTSNIHDNTADFSKVLDRIEADISAVSESFTPVRNVSATPKQPKMIGKRARSITADGSRPSSALSIHSDGDGMLSSTDHLSSATSSPAASRGRRTTTEMSSPILRVPLEKGWKRELVFRAALDSYSRRNADIYYYTPKGKKLRSTREVAEHLSGTGLTLDNFSFFKEPLGVDDPDKEIIRDAKLVRRVESPAAPPPPVEGRRVVKHKPPKGATPPPQSANTPTKNTTPAKIKVKSLGSRLSTSKTTPQQDKQKKTSTPNADNNNTTWKKPSGGRCDVSNMADIRPDTHTNTDTEPDTHTQEVARPLRQQPCSMECGGGSVPSLSCGGCLCLYHPPCVAATLGTPFICKNCSPVSPPQSDVQRPTATTPATNRLTLKMKMSGKSGGGREWSVSPSVSGVSSLSPHMSTSPHIPTTHTPTTHTQPTHIPPMPVIPTPMPVVQPAGPQALVSFNGKSFILVPRGVPHEA